MTAKPLGDFKVQFLEQRGQDGYEDLRRALEAIERRYPDVEEARTNAGDAAAMVACGEATLADVAHTWRIARMDERAAMEALTGAILWEAVRGATQASIIEDTGLAKASVAKAIRGRTAIDPTDS